MKFHSDSDVTVAMVFWLMVQHFSEPEGPLLHVWQTEMRLRAI